MGGLCGGGGGSDSFGGGNQDPYETPGTFGSLITTSDQNKPKEEKDDPPVVVPPQTIPFKSKKPEPKPEPKIEIPTMLGVLNDILSPLGFKAPPPEQKEGFTISSQAAPVPDPKPMKDLIPGFPDVPVDPEDMPLQDKTGFGATIKGGNIYAMKDDEGNVTGTLSALETLKDMKAVQDSAVFGEPAGTIVDSMPTLLDSLTGEALGQQMPFAPLGTVAQPSQVMQEFTPPPKLFGIFDPVYASPQPSFDAQLKMGEDRKLEKDSGPPVQKEPIFRYFQRAYKGVIPDRFLTGFLTRFGYSPTFIDQQMQVNEDGEIVDAQGNLIEGLPNVALIGEQIKKEIT